MNDDKAVKEVAERVEFRMNDGCYVIGGIQSTTRVTAEDAQELFNLCVSLTRELQAIREAAWEYFSAIDGGEWGVESELEVKLRAALEGK